MNVNIKGGISFNEYLQIKANSKPVERQKRARATKMAILQHNKRPATMVLIGGCSFENLLSACLESGYYKETNYEVKMRGE